MTHCTHFLTNSYHIYLTSQCITQTDRASTLLYSFIKTTYLPSSTASTRTASQITKNTPCHENMVISLWLSPLNYLPSYFTDYLPSYFTDYLPSYFTDYLPSCSSSGLMLQLCKISSISNLPFRICSYENYGP